MTHELEMLFLSKFIYESGKCSDPSACHSLVIRNFQLQLVPCTTLKPDDAIICRICPLELRDGMKYEKYVFLTDTYLRYKHQLGLNDTGGRDEHTDKNANG